MKSTIPRSPESTIRRVYLAAFGITALLCSTACARNVGSRDSAQVQRELEQELATLQPLENSIKADQYAHHGGQRALAGQKFRAARPYSDIRAHYDSQLIARGWHFERETHLKDWGRDFGGRDALYRRAEFVCHLQYAGERADYGWSYAIDLGWGTE